MTTNKRGNERPLEAVVIVAGALGLAFVVASATTVEVFDVLYSVDGASSRTAGDREYLRGVYGVLGAVMVGWMVVLHGLVRGPLRRRELWAWQLTARSVIVWFLLDSAVSAFFIPRNILLNLCFLIAFAVALTPLRSECRAVVPSGRSRPGLVGDPSTHED
jgi:hypothetical protein